MFEEENVLFDPRAMDALLENLGVDAVLVTSKHNVQYLLNGYRYPFFENFDAIGVSRYLPVLIYPKNRSSKAVYLGNEQEDSEVELGRIWCGTIETKFWGTIDTAAAIVRHLKSLELERSRIAIEYSFMPADVYEYLRSNLPNVRFQEAHIPLETLRSVKTKKELSIIKYVSECVVSSMSHTFSRAQRGMTKAQIVEILRQEETKRGLRFDWCFIGAGKSPNRAASSQTLQTGDIVSLDSGASMNGYFGDLCRMGIVGEPDNELRDLLKFVDDIQLKAREPIREGFLGQEIYEAVMPMIERSPVREHISFVAHGLGIIGHEAPRISDRGPVTYPADHARTPLESGIVLSIETTLCHPTRGTLKLEDTVVVQEMGSEGYGDDHRGWNIITDG